MSGGGINAPRPPAAGPKIHKTIVGAGRPSLPPKAVKQICAHEVAKPSQQAKPRQARPGHAKPGHAKPAGWGRPGWGRPGWGLAWRILGGTPPRTNFGPTGRDNQKLNFS